MNKSFRQGQILKVIRSGQIFTQDDLAGELKEKHGIQVTQVTLSRDMRELGLVKTQEGYRQVAAPTGPDFATIAGEFLWDVRFAQNLVVLKTSPAHASSVAVSLDQEEWPEVIGSIAGDDTVLVICADNAAAEQLSQRLLAFVQP
ncbi:MAG: arginine repressor [Bryobacteraceae bacterium]